MILRYDKLQILDFMYLYPYVVRLDKSIILREVIFLDFMIPVLFSVELLYSKRLYSAADTFCD